jgi:hypothetical protein
VLEICGVSSATARDVFIEVEGLNTIEAFGALSGDADVTEMAKRMASCTANVGRVILGTMQIKRIQALVFWVKDHERRQLDIEPNAWNKEELRATLARKEADQNLTLTLLTPISARPTSVGMLGRSLLQTSLVRQWGQQKSH